MTASGPSTVARSAVSKLPASDQATVERAIDVLRRLADADV
jgi:hypothetical protein